MKQVLNFPITVTVDKLGEIPGMLRLLADKYEQAMLTTTHRLLSKDGATFSNVHGECIIGIETVTEMPDGESTSK